MPLCDHVWTEFNETNRGLTLVLVLVGISQLIFYYISDEYLKLTSLTLLNMDLQRK